MMLKLWPIVVKESIELGRDRLSLGTYLLLPTFLLFLYGYAISLDVKHIKTVVCDLDRSNASQTLARKLFASEYFTSAGAAADERDLEDAMRRGDATAALLIHPGFARDLAAGRPAPLLIMLDGSNPQATQAALGYLYGIVGDYQVDLLDGFARKTGIRAAAAGVQERFWYNPRLETNKNLVTGLIAFVLMIVAVIATAISIVREKETGSIEQMVVTPVSAFHILAGKMIPYVGLSLIASALMIASAMIFFDVPFSGSPWVFVLALFIFLVAALGLGVLISTLARTQQMAFTAATFISVLPTQVLSGFIFPIDSMPVIIQYVTLIVPARYFIEITRSVMLKGTGLEPLWHDFAMLAAFAVVFLGAAAARIRLKGLL
jgi:ABC-2 type transport system permease protein